MSAESRTLSERISAEFFTALGGKPRGLLYRLFRVFISPATRPFGRIFEEADGCALAEGLPGAAGSVLSHLRVRVETRGLERVPRDGPLLVVSNHPGGYDSVSLLSSIPRRDLFAFVSDSGFLRAMRECAQHFLYVPEDPAANGRMTALRAGVQRLQAGAAVFMFAHGLLEPDPEYYPGASTELDNWSASIEILLRKAPSANLQLAIASGVVLPRYLYSPLTHLQRGQVPRLKLATYIEVAERLIAPRRLGWLSVHITFAQPIPAVELLQGQTMPRVIAAARTLLAEHLANWPPDPRYIPSFSG